MFSETENGAFIDIFADCSAKFDDGSADGLTLDGIFSDGAEDMDIMTGQAFSRDPMITVQWSLVQPFVVGGENGTRVTIDDIMYRVVDVANEDRRTGLAVLSLAQVEDL